MDVTVHVLNLTLKSLASTNFATRATVLGDFTSRKDSACSSLFNLFDLARFAMAARNELVAQQSKITRIAQVLELADKQDLGSCAFGREGSTPSLGTTLHGCEFARELRTGRARLETVDFQTSSAKHLS